MAAVFASLLLNAHAQAMPLDCHTAKVSVSTTHGPLTTSDDHHDKALKDKLCCANACVVCVASIPSPALVAWSDYIDPSYFPVVLASMTGQDTPAVFEPPRSTLF
ncbi:hypothetical protein [Rhizobium sp. GN54]|uniref:hypothetical protein n=1 Tax=Rhizobium sp. GN54 TaxID=2898150 RepID=UPI001E65560F|nr:hypothetical protein [Rhizobium sp. GN54]MCD2185449.1 hypothetical protein [Rhizobium sp. GN54]